MHLTPPNEEAKGKLIYLKKTIGTYDYDAVLNDEYVNKELEHLVGDNFDHLIKNLNVHAPVEYNADCLELKGNAIHQGAEEDGIVLVCMTNDEVHAGILSNAKVSIFSNAHDSHYPHALNEWIDAQNKWIQKKN